jgi:RNA polymerase sigma factor (TIGR02999 family)
MLNATSQQISRLLFDWSSGNHFALEELFPLVYDELRQIARRYMRRQRLGHTFQTTELIHEAYLKIARQDDINWQNRAHFFGVAAQAMRHILVDYARSKQSQKRGGIHQQITLDETALISKDNSGELVSLNETLEKLGKLDERKFRVVGMKFFGGLSIEEIAEVLKISPKTLKRDWQFSRTWLLRELSAN